MSIIGATISILFPVIIIMSSWRSGWGSVPNLLMLGLCGVTSVTLGITALITNNKGQSRSIATIILAAVSIALGTLILGLLAIGMVLLYMLAASMR